MPTTATTFHGDGTATVTTYDDNGQVTGTEQLTGLPIPPPPEPDRLGELAAALPAATLEEVNDLLAQVLSTLGGN